MNVERMKLVRDAVAANERFKMVPKQWPCGSPACVMGSARELMNQEEAKGMFENAWLGLIEEDYDHILLGRFVKSTRERPVTILANITKEETLAYLDRCIEAGRVIYD
jgi:hypothetical protein